MKKHKMTKKEDSEGYVGGRDDSKTDKKFSQFFFPCFVTDIPSEHSPAFQRALAASVRHLRTPSAD